jgi:hypothetical protein
VGFVPRAILERPPRVLLTEVDVDRFGIAGLDKRVQAHAEKRMRLAPMDHRFKVSTPAFRLPCRNSASAAASATFVSGGNRSSMNRWSQRNAARS